ncbi:hypothetical protein NS226_01515 [Aureimonas ureilytica]|uniref:Transposase-like Mu C-terminal domain-containing protein n=1 Tax=Aureimonas ureilytica TaxID=401562 RepID=A0A175RDC6_9HYPH|nr:Mu transposase C-terminal domain-containing protein [Aureimonas ureilytica]KTQ98248.1 hypothetical protein NS226_01515 [Aureimonas ureilytica]
MAAAAGCRSTWAMMCSVSTIAMDGGPENIDVRVRAAIRDTKAQTAYGMAGAPDERGFLERAFRTFDIQFAPLFQGRTFSNVVDKGDYKPEDVAEVLIEVLQPALLRYLVDFYHNAPHSGLAGQTPIDAWIEGTRTYGVLPPPSPSRLRAAFGLTVKRRIQNRGIVVAGLEYANEELAALRRQIGQSDVLVKIDTDDLGAISVRADRRGSSWISDAVERRASS